MYFYANYFMLLMIKSKRRDSGAAIAAIYYCRLISLQLLLYGKSR